MKEIKKDLITRQSNKFIEMCYQQEFTAIELKIIELIISKTKKEDLELLATNSNKKIIMTAKELAEQINTPVKNIYDIADNLSKKLISKNYVFKGEKKFIYQNFFVGFDYENGIFNINLNNFFIPYFVDIQEKFTNINFRFIVSLKSSYAIVLYKLLKQYQQIGKREFSVEELKKQMGIENKKSYTIYNNFKTKVIKAAMDHINKNSDINVSLKETKLSRKVERVEFLITKKLTQSDQAKAHFLEWALKSKNVLLVENVKNKKITELDFKQTIINDAFNHFLSKFITDYDPNSIKPLQMSPMA